MAMLCLSPARAMEGPFWLIHCGQKRMIAGGWPIVEMNDALTAMEKATANIPKCSGVVARAMMIIMK